MEPPRDITWPVGSVATTRAVLSAELKDRLAALSRLGRGPSTSPAVGRPIVAALDAFKRALRTSPGAAFSALRRPNVGVLVRTAGADPAQLARLAPTLLAELVAAGAEVARCDVDAPRVACLGAGRVLPGGAVTIADGAWRVDGVAHSLTTPGDALPVIFGAVRLGLVDDNPLAMNEAHPDKAGNAVDLGGQPVSAWIDSLREAFAVVEAHAPLVAEELRLTIHQLVPVGYDARAHLSASYREAIGTIYLSLHPDVMTMAEALVHELSHNKLNALMELDPLLENGFSLELPSPVRPDPRPLHGVLLAVHAFLPIERMYLAMQAAGDPRAASPRFARRLAQIVDTNRRGARTLLEHARPTPVGAGVIEEIERLSRDRPIG